MLVSKRKGARWLASSIVVMIFGDRGLGALRLWPLWRRHFGRASGYDGMLDEIAWELLLL
jgi:hypothetical protein